MKSFSQEELSQGLIGEIQTSESAITPEEPADVIVVIDKEKEGAK